MEPAVLQKQLEVQKKKSFPPITPTTVIGPIVPLTLLFCSSTDATPISSNIIFSPQSSKSVHNDNDSPCVVKMCNNSAKASPNEQKHFISSRENLSSSTSLLNHSIRKTALPFEAAKLDEDWRNMLSAAAASNKLNNITLVNFPLRDDYNSNNNNIMSSNYSNNKTNNCFNEELTESATTSRKTPLGFQNPSYTAFHSQALVPLQQGAVVEVEHQNLYNHHIKKQHASFSHLGSCDNFENHAYDTFDTSTRKPPILKFCHRSSSTDSIPQWCV